MQFVTTLMVVMGCLLIVTILLYGVGALFFRISSVDDYLTDNSSSELTLLRLQVVGGTIATFLIPALLLPRWLYKIPIKDFYGLKNQSGFNLFIIAAFCLAAVYPFLEWTYSLNKIMVSSDPQKEAILGKILQMNSLSDLIINLGIVALIPAIAEELFFRGFVQRTLFFWTSGKVHFSILITAVIFSFIHFEPDGFIPRVLLGLIFGYFTYASGNLKISMFTHFINNGMGVLISYLYSEADTGISTEISTLWIVTSFLAGSLLLYLFIKSSRKRSPNEIAETDNKVDEDVKWIRIHKTKDPFMAEIIAGSLHNEEIDNVVLNKRDSLYTLFGFMEIYVKEADEQRAQVVINQTNISQS